MPKRSRRARRRGGRRSPKWLPFNDYAGGVIGPSDVASWKRASFAMPVDRSFFIRGMYIQAIAEVASTSQGALGGACLQLEIYNPTGPTATMQLWNTGPIIIGTVPYRKYFKVKSLVFPPDMAMSAQLFTITNVCQRKVDTSSIRYVIRLDVEISPEEFGNQCPNLSGPPQSPLSDTESITSRLSDSFSHLRLC